MPISREDAGTVAEMLVKTGRAVPADQWVEVLVARAADRAEALALEGLF